MPLRVEWREWPKKILDECLINHQPFTQQINDVNLINIDGIAIYLQDFLPFREKVRGTIF